MPKEVANPTMMTVSQDDELGRVLANCRSLEKCHRMLAHVLRWKSIETLTKEPLSATEVDKSRTRWVKWVQVTMKEDLEESVHEAKDPIEDEGLESSTRKKV